VARPTFHTGAYDIKIACTKSPGMGDFVGTLLQLEWLHASPII